jgi:F-type H+-transporting ATPase subunit alpha
LEADLFNSGVRPAINVGISVSRVGGSAQIKPMKKVSGTLKLDQAQYRELEAFAKFGSDLDAATMSVINKGERNVEILKQGVNAPMSVAHQVAIIYVGSKGKLNKVPVNKVKAFESALIEYMEANKKDALNSIAGGKWTDAEIGAIEASIAEVLPNYEA